jgi:hypothetical protein
LNLALLDHEMRIGFGKPGTFQQRLVDFGFGGTFALQKEFILLASDGSSQHHFVRVFQRKRLSELPKTTSTKAFTAVLPLPSCNNA